MIQQLASEYMPKNMKVDGYLYTIVHSSIIHNAQKM